VHCCNVRGAAPQSAIFKIPSPIGFIMDNNTSPTNTTNGPASAPVTPFPASSGTARPASASKPDDASATAPKTGDAEAAAAPIVDRLIKRATSSAHDAVDGLAAKVSSLTDGLQDGVSKVGDTRDEWIESARDAIRQHPFAAVAGALVIGAALLSLSSSRRD
jgi:ElaB/YqjD/DUF883 family membrane-anchored ribosome-binding protein